MEYQLELIKSGKARRASVRAAQVEWEDVAISVMRLDAGLYCGPDANRPLSPRSRLPENAVAEANFRTKRRDPRNFRWNWLSSLPDAEELFSLGKRQRAAIDRHRAA